MELPDLLYDVLDEALTFDNPLLPQSYADPDGGPVHDGQGADGWEDAWFAFALNGRGEPYFVDLCERPAHPVYFAYLGGGHWEPLQVAANLDDWIYYTGRLSELEADPREASGWMDRHVDCEVEIWGDIQAAFAGDIARLETRRQSVAIVTSDYVYGHAVVTDLGENPDDVLGLLKDMLDLNERQWAALAGRGVIAVKHDRFVNLRDIIDQLTALGASVEFEEDDEQV
jgi:hypothetical protein